MTNEEFIKRLNTKDLAAYIKHDLWQYCHNKKCSNSQTCEECTEEWLQEERGE